MHLEEPLRNGEIPISFSFRWVTGHIPHQLPAFPSKTELQLPAVVTGFVIHRVLASFPSLPLLCPWPGVASHINFWHFHPCLKVYFW